MDGVFMRKIMILGLSAWMLWMLCWGGSVLAQRKMLDQQMIRLHILAESDEPEDQALKMQVKDAVTEYLNSAMGEISDTQSAKALLRESLPELEMLANLVLAGAGSEQRASVQLTRESFDTRHYETFSLPAGVYDSLKITIGQGQGHNWWCVVFPALCVPATSEGFQEAALEAGLAPSLTGALTGEEGYQVRFYFLDALGRIENFLHRG